MGVLWTFLIFILSILGVFYLWVKWSLGYWNRKGVPGPKPSFLVGNIGGNIKQQEALGETFQYIYEKTKETPYVGTYMLLRKTWVVNDLDLIRNILVKDFIHFPDHNVDFDYEVDPLAGHLFNLTGEKWKKLRNKLTPAFTTSKMKYMFETVEKCSREMQVYLDDQTKQHNQHFYDVKDLLSKFNANVIGSCAFGIECNSFEDPDSVFIKMGKKPFEQGFVRGLYSLLTFFAPKLMAKTGISVLGEDLNNFFHKTVENTIKYREDNNVVRNDFMQLLMQLKKDGYVEDEETDSSLQQDDGTRLTTMQIAAQVFVFFIAGYETSSSTASFALYEMALSPDIQDKLRKEIDSVLEKYKGKMTYDALAEMTYLNMVVDETLRKYPVIPLMLRICTKEYTIPDTDINIEKDTIVAIPTLGIHRDPDIYPEPLRFDPERFNPENKNTRHHYAYLPFGEGPRICIGNRFGLMQTKLGLVSILSKYEVSPCEKTIIPMKFNAKSFILGCEEGFWLKLTPRINGQ